MSSTNIPRGLPAFLRLGQDHGPVSEVPPSTGTRRAAVGRSLEPLISRNCVCPHAPAGPWCHHRMPGLAGYPLLAAGFCDHPGDVVPGLSKTLGQIFCIFPERERSTRRLALVHVPPAMWPRPYLCKIADHCLQPAMKLNDSPPRAEPWVRSGAAVAFNNVSFGYPGLAQVGPGQFHLRIQPRSNGFRTSVQFRPGGNPVCSLPCCTTILRRPARHITIDGQDIFRG